MITKYGALTAQHQVGPLPKMSDDMPSQLRVVEHLVGYSEVFLQSLQTTALDIELGIMARLDEALPSAQASPVQVAALGAAAVLVHNPVVPRRFFGGVREGEPVASPGSSSSDPSRRINQETVA